jgi:DNA-binding response OmpR family regulator
VVEFNPIENVVTIGERRVALARTEGDLLYTLMINAPRTVPFRELRESILRPDGRARSTLAVHVRYLREKIEPDPSRPRHILTSRRRGYRFQP